MILKKDKNELIIIIQQCHLNPRRFSAKNETIEKKQWFVVQLRNSPIRFAVRPSDSFDNFDCRYSLFEPGFPLTGKTYAPQTKTLYGTFKAWLSGVVKAYLDEADTPDLWQSLEETWAETVSEIYTTDYLKPFSEEEKTRIHLAIDEFQVLVVNNFNPNKEVLDDIKNSLKYLSDASDSQTKFQWKILALSIVLNIGFILALEPDKFQQLIQIFKQVFSKIIYLLP